jgi:hypothetical protein
MGESFPDIVSALNKWGCVKFCCMCGGILSRYRECSHEMKMCWVILSQYRASSHEMGMSEVIWLSEVLGFGW